STAGDIEPVGNGESPSLAETTVFAPDRAAHPGGSRRRAVHQRPGGDRSKSAGCDRQAGDHSQRYPVLRVSPDGSAISPDSPGMAAVALSATGRPEGGSLFFAYRQDQGSRPADRGFRGSAEAGS